MTSHSRLRGIPKPASWLTTPRAYAAFIAVDSRSAIGIVGAHAASGLLQMAALATVLPLLRHAVSPATSGAALSNAQLGRSVGGFLLLGLAAAAAKLCGDRLATRFRTRVEAQVTSRFFDALPGMRWERFQELRLGEVAKAILADVNRAVLGAEQLLTASASLCAALILLTAAAFLTPEAVFLLLFTLLFGVVGHRRMGLRYARLARDKASAARQYAQTFTEVMANWKYLKSSGDDTLGLDHARRHLSHLHQQMTGTQKASQSIQFATEASVVLFVGIYLAYLGVSSRVGEHLVFLGLMLRAFPYLMAANRQFNNAKENQFAALACESLESRIQAGGELDSGRIRPTFDRKIAMDAVTFRYHAQGQRHAIAGATWSLRKGECLAILGDSGSGKSTMMDLLTGLLRPESGRITVDDVPLTDLNLRDWRRCIGFVPQSCPIFHGTVLSNIALGDPKPNRAKARRCAEMANALEYVDLMPGGLDGEIAEGGASLSGGQRQRLAIARALYRDPQLLLLDEATSALDDTCEQIVRETIARLKGSVTMILITHRSELAAVADRALSIKDGHIIGLRHFDRHATVSP